MMPAYPVADQLPRDIPVIERPGPATLESIAEDLRDVRMILGPAVAAIHHILEELSRQNEIIDAISGEAHDTHETVKSIRAEQVTLAAVLEHAALLREMHEREVAQRHARSEADTLTELSDTEPPERQ